MLVEMTETKKKDWDKFEQWQSWTEVACQALYEMYESKIPIEVCSDAIRPIIEQLDYEYELGQYERDDDEGGE